MRIWSAAGDTLRWSQQTLPSQGTGRNLRIASCGLFLVTSRKATDSLRPSLVSKLPGQQRHTETGARHPVERPAEK